MQNETAPTKHSSQRVGIENQKGGVGKTTVAYTLATGLALRGFKVVAIDTDPQGSLSKLMGHPDDGALYKTLVGGAHLTDVTHAVDGSRWKSVVGAAAENMKLHILPGSQDTALIPALKPDDIYMMLDLMSAIDRYFAPDVIIVDTSPSVSGLTGPLRLALDWLLYITECEPLALDGLAKALTQIERQAQKRGEYMGRTTEIMGIVPNKLNAKTVLHRELVSDLAQARPNQVWPPIYDRIDWANATYFRVPVFVSAPNKQAAKDAWALVDKAVEVLRGK